MKVRRQTPYSFVVEALERAQPLLKPMFGCVAVYVDDKIVFALRDKDDSHVEDNGVWLATSAEHHDSLKLEFPNMRRINLLANGAPTGWQNLPAECDDFEAMALKAVRLVLKGDPRIGKKPKPRTKKKAKKK